MNFIFRKIVLITIGIFTIVILVHWDLIRYGLQQGKGQLSIMLHAEPLDFYLRDSSFPDSLKSKIEFVKVVRSFATEELGFSAEDQYQKMYDQKGKELMWVVTAAYPYKLESYEWQFPVLGKVAYKGFFVEEEAHKLVEEQTRKGFDVRLRTASAWSTLGWLDDPLLSNVLNYSYGRLAELIFHELTHDEIFIKDSIDFNENLASFFGQEFTKLFFQKLGYQDSAVYQKYIDQLEYRHSRNSFISNYLPKFDSMYQQIEHFNTVEKENEKYTFFNHFKKELQKLGTKHDLSSDYTDVKFNNAYLLSYKRYAGNHQILSQELQYNFNGDVLKMLDYYQNNFNSL